MLHPQLRLLVVAASLLALPVTARGLYGQRKAASPGYRGRDPCPARCYIAGPSPGNWSLYHNLDQVQACQQAVFYDFSLYDRVDDQDTFHRIYACSSYGPDWANLPNATTNAAPAKATGALYTIGWDGDGGLAGGDIRGLSKQIRQYLGSGYRATSHAATLFAHFGRGSVGIYIGKGLQNEATSAFALQALEAAIPDLNGNFSGLAMQFCEPGSDSDHIFGFMATSNGSFAPVQTALQSWSNATCLSFPGTKNVTGPAFFTTPLAAVVANNATSINGTNSTSLAAFRRSGSAQLAPRNTCRTIQVIQGDGCPSLAVRCGVSGDAFDSYNPGSTFCSSLQAMQHVCCSAGTLPSYAPSPNGDGSCATHAVLPTEFCNEIAANYSLTLDQLTSYNAHTWAFNGCGDLWTGTVICVSPGTPPMPAPVANAVCGPQVPGTPKPASGVDISSLNPCLLNACCDVWGQCGTTDEFCTNTSTGAPGTATTGTNGCISNCGTNIVLGGAPAVFRNIAYFEGYSLDRPCLYQDASQIDASQYTHVHFAFATLTADYQVQIGDDLASYEFKKFKNIKGVARILSFGGWDFSTSPSTYTIFRQGVTAANRVTMATNIANFIVSNGLDGVDIDWEYPGAPDIPGIPPADPNDGSNYLDFLVILKNLLSGSGKSISIAAPSSYWYLKGFPIAEMSLIVDYIVYMTYDLHGQWDANNQWSQEGCATGTCLRTDVNLTETIGALVMITKAGVPSGKVVVGVTSYGRSFNMAQAGCYTENCFFTGTSTQSDATVGPCTNTAGYISNAEINDILNSNRVNQNYVDGPSNTNILVYDNTQWIGWMSPSIKASRKAVYEVLKMGGASDWASDLASYNDVPSVSASWANFILDIKGGTDPQTYGDRTGNWTTVSCGDPSEDVRAYTPSERWSMMDGPNAWSDVIGTWQKIDKASGMTFSHSIAASVNGPENADCSTLARTNNCEQTVSCPKGDTAAAGYEIWNSFVYINEMYGSYLDAIHAATGVIATALPDFENKFSPVPDPENDGWLQILLDLFGLGTAMIAAPFFTAYLVELLFFELISEEATEQVQDISKDIAYAMLATGISIAKDLTASNSANTPWNPQKQAEFSNTMGQVLQGWANATAVAAKALFDGTDSSIATLTSLIAQGQFLEGKFTGSSDTGSPPNAYNTSDLAVEQSIAKAFFAYSIPALWSVSGTSAFVMDSGYSCDAVVDPGSQYLDNDTMVSTKSCFQGSQYYLVYPDGPWEWCSDTCVNSVFSAAPGLDALDGNNFGGITLDNLVAGAVNTYNANGKQNNGAPADPTSQTTFDDLFGQDVTTPGYIRIPVCSPAIAFAAWSQAGGPTPGIPGWPCTPPMAISDCDDSTFVDQTTDGSPTVEDCMGIINNIAGGDGEWEVENVIAEQHQIVGYGSCNFGVQGSGSAPNLGFKVGAQDIVDLIQSSIQKYEWNGKVGAEGVMPCRGTSTEVTVTWGIY